MKKNIKFFKILSLITITSSIFIPLVTLASCAQEKQFPPPPSIDNISGGFTTLETAVGCAKNSRSNPFISGIDSTKYNDSVIWYLVDSNDPTIVHDYVSINSDGEVFITQNTNKAEVLKLQVYCKSAVDDEVISVKKEIEIKIVDDSYNGCHYKLNDDNKYILTGYDGNIKDITISEQKNNVDVVGIDYHAFIDNNSIETITIANNITSISNFAFSNCNNLKTLTFGNGIVSFASQIIFACPNIDTFIFGDRVENIEQGFFDEFLDTKSILFTPNNTRFSMATNVGTNGSIALNDTSAKLKPDCSNILFPTVCGEIILDNTITGISANVFKDNLFLTTINIPVTVKNIIAYAFNGCSNLTNVYFNWSVCPNNMSDNIFFNCKNLKTIHLPSGYDADSYKWATDGRTVVEF